ncbi:MAG: hypothetical protein WCX12_03145 [Candidatus Paceibacterota bacterium]|jgi:hypothetical protein
MFAVAQYFNLVALILLFAAQIFWGRRFLDSKREGKFSRETVKKYLKILWLILFVIVVAVNVYISYKQYQVWESNPLSRGLLPPYAPISYFLSYVFVHFFIFWIVAFLASILVSRLAKFLNKRFGNRFFENEEVELIALGTFLSGYPGFLFFWAAILIFGVLFSVVYTIFSKGRLPLFYFWLPIAIFAIIVKIWLLPIFGLEYVWGQLSLGDFIGLFLGK